MRHLSEVVVRELLHLRELATSRDWQAVAAAKERDNALVECKGLKAKVAELEGKLKLAQDVGAADVERLAAASKEVQRLTNALLEAGESCLNMQTEVEEMRKNFQKQVADMKKAARKRRSRR